MESVKFNHSNVDQRATVVRRSPGRAMAMQWPVNAKKGDVDGIRFMRTGRSEGFLLWRYGCVLYSKDQRTMQGRGRDMRCIGRGREEGVTIKFVGGYTTHIVPGLEHLIMAACWLE